MTVLFCLNGAIMVSRCANPSCETEFRYLHEGRLYHFALCDRKPGASGQTDSTVPFWWLCSRCCVSFVLVPDDSFGVRIVSKHENRGASHQSSEKRELSYEQASYFGG